MIRLDASGTFASEFVVMFPNKFVPDSLRIYQHMESAGKRFGQMHIKPLHFLTIELPERLDAVAKNFLKRVSSTKAGHQHTNPFYKKQTRPARRISVDLYLQKVPSLQVYLEMLKS
eukprot:s1717_g9.t1